MDTQIKEQRLSIWEIMKLTWVFIKNNFIQLFIFLILIYLPVEIIVSLIQEWLTVSIEHVSWTVLSISYGIKIMTLVFELGIAIGVFNYFFNEKKVHVSDLIEQSTKIWPKAMITFLLMSMILTALTMLFIIPGLVFVVYFKFTIIIVGVRGIWGLYALEYSRKTVQGNWWKVFGLYLLSFVVFFCLEQVISQALVGIPVVITVLVQVVKNIFNLFTASFFTILFLNIESCKRLNISNQRS